MLTAAIFLVASILSSCKSHELCPAYGKVSIKEKAEKQA